MQHLTDFIRALYPHLGGTFQVSMVEEGAPTLNRPIGRGCQQEDIAPNECDVVLCKIEGKCRRRAAALVISCVGASLLSSGKLCEQPLSFERQSLRASPQP